MLEARQGVGTQDWGSPYTTLKQNSKLSSSNAEFGAGAQHTGTGPGAPPIQVPDKSGTGTGELAPGPGRRRTNDVTNHWQGPSPGAAGP